jgi:peptide-methionine (S)-S-oxide reductase
VAEDPVRNNKLPKNIAQVARAIIKAAEREGVDNLQEQLEYALRLVSWSWVARKCNVQIELIDVLIDAGASPDGNPVNALVNGNFAAAEHLVERGAKLTLAVALCLERWEEVTRLAQTASASEKQFGFILAALNGKAEALRRMIDLGVDLNRPSADLYSHATALHHAVCSGSLEAVKDLVEAGAELGTKDRAWHATPLEWAEHYIREAKGDDAGKQYPEIAAYLREMSANRASCTEVDAKEPPARPSLEEYERLANDLVEAYRSGDAMAMLRLEDHFQFSFTWDQLRAQVQEHLRTLPDAESRIVNFALADAQQIIARLHRFESWAALVKHIER